MSDDLVKRLRGYGSNRYWPHGPACDCTKAADRIEELEAENKRLEGEIESMRAERLERDRTILAELTGGKDE